MTQGITAELNELIALQAQAQRVRYRWNHPAARAGNHRSKIRGRGMDFLETRNYQAGDEIRHMEWRVTARTGRPHVKIYQEERERPVVILTDFSPSMYFGTQRAFKSVIAARLASIIAWTAAKQGDRVGGLVCSAQSHHELLPRTRQNGVLPLLSALSFYSKQPQQSEQPTDEQDSLCRSLNRLKRVTKPGSILVLVSDFYGLDHDCDAPLNRLRRHNDVLIYHVCDALELSPPKPQRYLITDGKQDLCLDTSLDSLRFGYQFYCEQRVRDLQERCERLQIQYTQVTSTMDLAQLVRQTFPWRNLGRLA